jgi:hypothetical protein
MDLIKIDASQYGLEEKKAKQITDMFMPMLEKMEALEDAYNSIIKLPVNPDTISKAKALRLEYVKVRTGTDKIHKELKKFYIQGGKFVDGWKNAQRMASEGNEKRLMDIEKHFENIEKEKRELRLQERIGVLSGYGCVKIPDSLVDMEEDVWSNYLYGIKKNFEAVQEAKRKAEEERIRKEKEEEEERKRIQEENARLKKEAEERKKAEQERMEKEAEEKRQREKREEAERIAREKIEAERRKKEEAERKAKELELKKEREEKARIEAELKKKEEEERRKEEEEKARIEAELQKGDVEKTKDLINDLISMKHKYKFDSIKNKKMYGAVCLLLDKMIEYIKQRIK